MKQLVFVLLILLFPIATFAEEDTPSAEPDLCKSVEDLASHQLDLIINQWTVYDKQSNFFADVMYYLDTNELEGDKVLLNNFHQSLSDQIDILEDNLRIFSDFLILYSDICGNDRYHKRQIKKLLKDIEIWSKKYRPQDENVDEEL